MKDYYKVLGIPRHATHQDIRKAYLALSREHHSDVSKTPLISESKIREINEAYETLGDRDKRVIYDQNQRQSLVTDLDQEAANVVDEYFEQFKK